ncbi:MAG: nitroreductase family deazaflavin-dependent oxidoreductase [Acidimicrobiia bacterium]
MHTTTTTTTPTTSTTATPTASATATTRYLRPGWFTQQVVNRGIRRLARLGVAPAGLRELRVRGRRTGELRSVPVNLLELDGRRYLVAPRGTTEWVRNLRAAGEGELRVGRQIERFRAVELDDAAKPPVLREYLRRWKAEVKAFFEDLDESSSDERVAEVAAGFPVFEVRST